MEILKDIIVKMQKEDGQGLVEYALIILLVVVVAVIGLTVFGAALSATYGTIVGSF